MIFKFRLEPVLKYREFLEDQKKMEFAEKQKTYLDNKRRGEMLREMRTSYHEAMRKEAASEDVSVTRLSFYQSYIFVIERQIEQQDRKTKAAKKIMIKSQEELNETRKNKEVMIRAREKSYQKYLYKEQLETQKVLDDMANNKFIRINNGLDSSATATRIDLR